MDIVGPIYYNTCRQNKYNNLSARPGVLQDKRYPKNKHLMLKSIFTLMFIFKKNFCIYIIAMFQGNGWKRHKTFYLLRIRDLIKI